MNAMKSLQACSRTCPGRTLFSVLKQLFMILFVSRGNEGYRYLFLKLRTFEEDSNLSDSFHHEQTSREQRML